MIYLDHAATSYPKPAPVVRALGQAAVTFGGNPGRGGHRLSLAAAEMVYTCRCEIADFFGLNTPERVVFTSGATMALNLSIYTRARRGIHILLSDREHNAVLRPVLRLAKEGIAEYDIYPTEGDIVAAIRERIRKNTELLIACHVSNVTGLTLPLESIATLCREKGINLIIDAAQSAGHMPIDLDRIPFDSFCAPAHKGLLGVAGCGFAILNDIQDRSPFLSGGSGVDSLAHDMPDYLPERYEAGTLPTPAIAALLAGVRYLRSYGVERIASEGQAIKKKILEGLSVMQGIHLYEPGCDAGLLAFTHATLSPEEIARRLDERGICVRSGYHCAPLAHRTIQTPAGGCVRLSIGHGNRLSDADRLISALSEILR